MYICRCLVMLFALLHVIEFVFVCVGGRAGVKKGELVGGRVVGCVVV
jgi:hypothetical protein